MNRAAAVAWVLVAVASLPSAGRGVEPVNPKLIPEARKLLDYLEGVYGKKTLSGISDYGGGWQTIQAVSGREPAVYTTDAFGWNKPKWGESYDGVMRRMLARCRYWWQEKGGVVAMQFHWGRPGLAHGSAWSGKGPKGTGPYDVGKAVTPGTREHRETMDDLRRTADYLEELADARVPVLWRPLHEIDGGWFWWTDKERPENTARLWRMIFEYFTTERELHNLIWIYNAAHVAGAIRKQNLPFAEQVPFRKRYYPGGRYVDIGSIDIYPNARAGYPQPTEATYPGAFEMTRAICPGKIIAMAETSALCNPDMLAEKGPPWLYCLPWFATARGPDWTRKAYNHKQFLTLDELPAGLTGKNVMPNVWIEAPADGAFLPAGKIALRGRAGDRDGNLAGLKVVALEGAWKHWHEAGDEALAEAIAGGRVIGKPTVADDGAWSFDWADPSGGWVSVVAVARDAAGAEATSNVLRLAVGIENLAGGEGVKMSASERADRAANVLDGDPFTGWRAGGGEQWLAVDLGASKAVGGAMILWGGSYAADYDVQVSADGKAWHVAGEVRSRRLRKGGAAVVRFQPVKARHVRILARRSGGRPEAYAIGELALLGPKAGSRPVRDMRLLPAHEGIPTDPFK